MVPPNFPSNLFSTIRTRFEEQFMAGEGVIIDG